MEGNILEEVHKVSLSLKNTWVDSFDIIQPGSIIRDPSSGKLFLYFSAFTNSGKGCIGLAIGESLFKFRLFGDIPLISSAGTQHEKTGVADPTVNIIDNRFLMLYTGHDNSNNNVKNLTAYINLAISLDGKRYKKYRNNPFINRYLDGTYTKARIYSASNFFSTEYSPFTFLFGAEDFPTESVTQMGLAFVDITKIKNLLRDHPKMDFSENGH